MSQNKTVENDGNVMSFLESVQDPVRKRDSLTILKLMQQISGEEPKMWGDSLVGFGKYPYKYESGREGEWFYTGFSPRKQSLTLYMMFGFKKLDDLLLKLGKYKTGKSCLYIHNLEEVNMEILEQMISRTIIIGKRKTL